MAIPSIPPELVDLLKVGGGAVAGVVGKVFADRRRTRADRAAEARGLAACSAPMLAELDRATRDLERALLGDGQALVSFFSMERALLAPRDVEELSKRVRENATLDHTSLTLWREAEDLVVEAQTVYGNLRERSVLPGEVRRIATQIPPLQQLVTRAHVGLQRALADLSRYAAKDTKQLLAKHSNER